MSPAMSALTSIGITQQVLILAVLALVAAGVIGMFWHIIVPGAIIVLVGSLFINFSAISIPDAPTISTVAPSKPPVIINEPSDDQQAFMEDCMNVAQYTMYECKKLWNSHEPENAKVTNVKVDRADSSELQLLEVDNVEYKARRDETLKKPGAVVGRVTYR